MCPCPRQAGAEIGHLESRRECRRAGRPKRRAMLSVPHLIIIFLVALVVFGPEKLPELARNFGKVMAEFRRATGDLRSTFEDHLRDLEREADERRIGSGRGEATAAPAGTGAPKANAPANVVAATPLSARLRPELSSTENEETPATESVLDPAARLAPSSTSLEAQPAESENQSEIVSDGHSSS
jgi:sec-independent protein translocase protein TatB